MRALCFSICFWLTISHVYATHSNYVIGVNNAYNNDVGKEAVKQLFTKMYAPLQIKPEIRFFPSLRGLKMADHGEIDAEAGRVQSVAQTYANLIAVPEPMMRHQMAFFCLKERNCAEQKDLRYALISGFVAGKQYCTQSQLNCLLDQSQSFLSKALTTGAIDVLIGSRAIAVDLLCQSQLTKVFYKEHYGFEVVSYHLINKRHAHLRDELAKSIKMMKKDGQFDTFMKRTSAKYKGCAVQLEKLNDR